MLGKRKQSRPSKEKNQASLESPSVNTQQEIENPTKNVKHRKNIENGNDQIIINELIQPRRGRSKQTNSEVDKEVEHKKKGRPRKIHKTNFKVQEVHQNGTEKIELNRLGKQSLNIKPDELDTKKKLIKERRLIKENSEETNENGECKPEFGTRFNVDNEKLELDIKEESKKKGKPKKSSAKKSNFEETGKNSNNDVSESVYNESNESQALPRNRGRSKSTVKESNFEETQENSNIEPDESIANENEELQAIAKKRGRPKRTSVQESNFEETQESSNIEPDESIANENEELQAIAKKRGRPKRTSVQESNFEETQENSNIEPDESIANENEELQAIAKKRGRPKRTSVQESNFEETEENSNIEPDASINENEILQAIPKKRGRPKRTSVQESKFEETPENSNIEPDESIANENEELQAIPKKRGRPKRTSVQESKFEETPENSNIEPDASINENEILQAIPKKRGRPKRTSVQESKFEETPENSNNEPDASINENEILQAIPKKRGRPKRTSVQESKFEETPENSNIEPNASIKNENEEFQAIPKKRGRPKKTSVQESNFEETPENSNIELNASIKNENEEFQAIPKKRGRPRRSKESNSEEENDEFEVLANKRKFKNIDDETKVKRGRERKSFKRYSNNYDDSMLNYNERIDLTTKVSNKKKIVECDVCNESMTIFKYQKEHMPIHNYLCWLKGEAPLDLKNEIVVERILNRAKLYNKKAIFKCPVCNKPNKSGRGYLSHIQFCGKTDEERLSVMSPCELCGKLLMPASVDSHLYHMHNPNKKQEPILEETIGARKAAEKCLKSLSVYTGHGGKKSNLVIDSDDECTEFYTEVKIVKKDYIDEWTKAFLNDETVNCPCPNCDFKTERMTQLKEHFKICSVKSKKFKCLECEFLTENEKEVVSHIKTLHALGVQMSRKKSKALEKNIETVSELPYIPFVKYAEHMGKSSINGLHKFFMNSLTWTKEQHALHYSKEKLFPSLSFEMDEWKFINENEVKEYIQHTEQSIRINFKDEWFSLKRYETSIQDNLAVIFCGGPVFGLAWAPGTDRQFLAIGAHLSMTDFYQVSSTCAGPGNIQIWSFGNMNNEKDSQVNDAKLEYLICHESRGAWSLDWCPSGCRDERMGLLAVGTASGSVIIFSIPMPNTENSLFPACKPKPILNLEISPNERYHCTKVAWSKVKPHNTIVGGFSNGYVAVWEIDTESFLLKKGRTIYPYKIFQAHHSIITGLCFSPLSNTFIVTSAHDKMIKYWDLNDITAPVSKNSRHLATDISWLLHWMTCAYSIDNLCSGSEATMCFNSIRDIVYELQTYVSGVKAPATSISASDWLNGIALAHDNGQINLAFGKKQPQASHDERKKYIKVLIEPNLYDFNNEKYVKKKSKNDEDYDWDDSVEYEDTVKKYGIHFKTNFCFGFEDNLRGNPPNPINIYPVITANKIAWNPNISSFLHMAVGYQNGLVILPKIILSPWDQFKVDKFDD